MRRVAESSDTGLVVYRTRVPRPGDQVSRRLALLAAAVMLATLAIAPVSVPAAAQANADAAGTVIGATLQRRLQDVIDLARPRKGVPGISAAVATPDDMWLGVTGQQRFDPDVAVRADTPFEIGSVTKTFVAAVILELREEGKLKLSDRLSRWEQHIPY